MTMDEWNELLDAYAYEMEIASAGYEMMGRMLDHRAVTVSYTHLTLPTKLEV